MARYWFKPRRYGYGATPATWQGWAVTLAVIAIVIGLIVGMGMLLDRSDFKAQMILAGAIGAISFWYARFARNRTDGEWRWRWGGRAGTTTDLKL
jgi:uncharacterized membrane protein